MHREQWIVLLLGICELEVAASDDRIQYLDRRYVYGMPPEGVWEMFRFLAPYGLFAAGVVVLVVILLLAMRRK